MFSSYNEMALRFILANCKIRAIPHSDSGVFRTVIPGHAAHRFRGIPHTFFKMGREKNAG